MCKQAQLHTWGSICHKVSAIANNLIDFETVSLLAVVDYQSGPPENFILASAFLTVSETSSYYRVEAAVPPHHRHAGDAQPSAQPIHHGPAISNGQPIDSTDPSIDHGPAIGSGPAIGEAGARGL